jgi:hypothetical protein
MSAASRLMCLDISIASKGNEGSRIVTTIPRLANTVEVIALDFVHDHHCHFFLLSIVFRYPHPSMGV